MRWGRKHLIALALAVAPWFLMAHSAGAETRIALVIGNGAYTTISSLDNPPNDAALTTEALTKTGFEVDQHVDVDATAMRRAILQFGRKLRAAGPDAVGLFYYAGHGVQASGINYLVPIGTDIQDEAELSVLAVEMDWVIKQMEAAGNDINMVILDACRNNPFKSSFRSASRGLAKITAPRGTYIAYATAPGEVAEDGTGVNSPFTKAFAEHITTPGLPVETVFKRVRASVQEATGMRQLPWDSSSLTGEFYFVKPQVAALPVDPEPAAAPAPASQAAPQAVRSFVDTGENERLFYETVNAMASGDGKVRALEAYLSKFPQGQFTMLAEIQLASERKLIEERLAAQEAAKKAAEEAAQQEAQQLAEASAAEQAAAPPLETAAGPDEAVGEADTQIAALPTAPEDRAQSEDPESIEEKLNLTRSERRLVQESLSALGFDTRGVDGALGRNSRRAIMAWQEQSGFEPTGYLTASQHGVLLGEAKPAVERWRAERRAAAARNVGLGDKQSGGPEVRVMNMTNAGISQVDFNQIVSTIKGGLSRHWSSIVGIELQITNAFVRQEANEEAIGAQIIAGLLGGAASGLARQNPATVNVNSAEVRAKVTTRDRGGWTEVARVERYDYTNSPGQMMPAIRQAAQNAVSMVNARLSGVTPSAGLAHQVVGRRAPSGGTNRSTSGFR